MKLVSISYRRWRHAGEEGAIAVYGYPTSWRTPLALVGTLVALILFLLHLQYFAIVILIVAFQAIPYLSRFRKAVILTPTVVRIRPSLGEVWEFPFWFVKRVKRTNITEMISWKVPIDVPAVELILGDGQRLLVSLNVPNGEELLQRLCGMTNLQCL